MSRATYIIDILLADVLHHGLELDFIIVDPLSKQAKRVLDQVELVHHFVKGRLHLGSQHLEGWSNSLIAKDLLLWRLSGPRW